VIFFEKTFGRDFLVLGADHVPACLAMYQKACIKLILIHGHVLIVLLM
jgi:hypothetical protein